MGITKSPIRTMCINPRHFLLAIRGVIPTIPWLSACRIYNTGGTPSGFGFLRKTRLEDFFSPIMNYIHLSHSIKLDWNWPLLVEMRRWAEVLKVFVVQGAFLFRKPTESSRETLMTLTAALQSVPTTNCNDTIVSSAREVPYGAKPKIINTRSPLSKAFMWSFLIFSSHPFIGNAP
jgi:hypothetical protein